jgi:hypothetical protein
MKYFHQQRQRREVMKYRCIVCKTTWGEGDPEIDGYSDGLCEKHQMILLVKLYRESQAKQGNPTCCGRSEGYCDQWNCKYRSVCLAEGRPSAEQIDQALEILAAASAAQVAERKAKLQAQFDHPVEDAHVFN